MKGLLEARDHGLVGGGEAMLVVISDLHLSDGSATDNVPAEAFAIWLDEIASLAIANEAKEIRFLYLGDIFDLLRTEYWFYPGEGSALPDLPPAPQPEEFPREHRPWGDAAVNKRGGAPSGACLERAERILDAIVDRCAGQLAMLRGDVGAARAHLDPGSTALLDQIDKSFAALQASGVQVSRLYVPGNHDRLVLHSASMKTKMLAALGASDGGHAFRNADYAVIARHGHEWDLWNFEAYRDNQNVHTIPPDAFGLVPIGDPITTELAARAPFLAFHELTEAAKGGALAAATVKAVYGHLKQIEDVRPLTAAITWMLTEGRNAARALPAAEQQIVRDVLAKVVKRLMADFMSIDFVHAWLDSHDRFNFGLDEADKLQDVDRAIRFFSFETLEKGLAAVEVVQKLGTALRPGLDECARGAAEERLLSDAWADKGIRYCVYGHTHDFRHEPLSCDPEGLERVYLNSGTWRRRVAETRAGKSFVRFKEMTYLVFYRADEDELHDADKKQLTKGTSYETWNGLMLKRER